MKAPTNAGGKTDPFCWQGAADRELNAPLAVLPSAKSPWLGLPTRHTCVTLLRAHRVWSCCLGIVDLSFLRYQVETLWLGAALWPFSGEQFSPTDCRGQGWNPEEPGIPDPPLSLTAAQPAAMLAAQIGRKHASSSFFCRPSRDY